MQMLALAVTAAEDADAVWHCGTSLHWGAAPVEDRVDLG